MQSLVTDNGDLRIMSHYTFQQAATVLTAIVLFLQSAMAMSGGCACVEAATPKKSCCQAEAVVSSCCGEAKSYCQPGKCGWAESTTTSGCRCGCSDRPENAPFTPAEKSERKSSDVEVSFAIAHLAASSMTQLPDFRHALASVPCARSGPHAMQAILCIWRT